MIKKLFGVTAVLAAIATAAPAPAIDFLCSCRLCTSPTQGLGCRDDYNGYRFTSCGNYYTQHCAR